MAVCAKLFHGVTAAGNSKAMNLLTENQYMEQNISSAPYAAAKGASESNESKHNERNAAVHQYKAGTYEGPLDLLWQLIKESRINVYDIPIADITEQYLEYLDYAASADLGDLSDFYNWAAKLLYIKSRMLLPVQITNDDEEEEDPRDELVNTLIEYQKYRRLSELMEEAEDTAEYTFERANIQRILPFDDGDSVWDEVDTWDLLQQMQRVFQNLISRFPKDKIINMYEEVSVNEKLTLIREKLEEAGECMFSELLTRPGNYMDIVCAFMALLEAVKSCVISVYQNRLFGDIKIAKRNGNDGAINS